jgi:hypothetical protein
MSIWKGHRPEIGECPFISWSYLAYGGASLKGAIMLNGQKYEEWLKSKDREEDG